MEAISQWRLVEEKRDGDTYSFLVFNGKQTFKAELKLTNDQFEGSWKERRAAGESGRINLIRKK
ncbi:MAG TPA: hypothetical protein VI479_10255 [Blastocatellia bacterium]